MNKEYIDLKRRIVYRGEVYQAIEDERIKTLPAVLNNRYMDGVHDGLKNALRALAKVNDISAADVVEVRHGEWVLSVYTVDIPDIHRWHEWHCSNCGYVRKAGWEHTEDGRKPKAKYCENCCSKMDGGANDV